MSPFFFIIIKMEDLEKQFVEVKWRQVYLPNNDEVCHAGKI